MTKFVLVALLSIFALSKASFAGIVIEPQVGYSIGEFSPNTTGMPSADISGPSLGAKFYYNAPAWFLGVDYNYNKLKIKDADAHLTNNELGAIVGINFAHFFKLYGGYILSNNAKVDDFEFKSNGGYKVGLAFRALRNVSLGLEYKKISYKKQLTFANDPYYTATTFLISFPFGM